jgi:hypothetical protein
MILLPRARKAPIMPIMSPNPRRMPLEKRKKMIGSLPIENYRREILPSR